MTRPSSRSAIALFVSCMAAACGGAAPAPAMKAPSAPESEAASQAEPAEPRSIEEAQDWIARARADLEQPPKLESSRAADAPATAPEGGAAPAREERPRSSEGSCGGSCRALASMKRAVDALCRMTGDADERCAEARRTLSDSTTRLATCKCDG